MAAFTATCRYCAVPFEAQRSTARYCTEAHRTRAREARLRDDAAEREARFRDDAAEREARFRADARALLEATTAATIARGTAAMTGDRSGVAEAEAALADLDRRTAALFGVPTFPLAA